MRVLRFEKFGPPADVLHLEDLPTPQPRPNQVRLRLTYRPINPSDLLTISGEYGRLPRLPAYASTKTRNRQKRPSPACVIIEGFARIPSCLQWADRVFTNPSQDQEPIMAVQQNKKSPSKRGMHRSHNALNVPGIALEPTTGEVHLRHHISPNGFYRGRQVLKNKSEA